MIEKEKVRHIADLAKLNIKEDEMVKYQEQLTDILCEVDKILQVNISEENIMISPSDNQNCFCEDVIKPHLDRKDMLKNAKRIKGGYIVVPKVRE